MKIKYKQTSGPVIAEFTQKDATLEEAVELLKSPNVISISVTKETPAQYMNRAPALNPVLPVESIV